MFFGAAAFAFQAVPEPEDGTPVVFSVCWSSEAPQPKIADPPAIIGFVLDPVGDRVGRVLHTAPLPMPAEERMKHFVGVRSGPDGRAWLAGGPLTVMLDGVSLGETGPRLSERRATPGPEVRSILHRMP